MRISDWSSDVCSSDLHRAVVVDGEVRGVLEERRLRAASAVTAHQGNTGEARERLHPDMVGTGLRRGKRTRFVVAIHERTAIVHGEIGRASCRERVCQYV